MILASSGLVYTTEYYYWLMTGFCFFFSRVKIDLGRILIFNDKLTTNCATLNLVTKCTHTVHEQFFCISISHKIVFPKTRLYHKETLSDGTFPCKFLYLCLFILNNPPFSNRTPSPPTSSPTCQRPFKP